MSTNLMTLKEVADMLRLSQQTLYKLLKAGEIPAIKVGSQWRFDRDRILSWLEEQQQDLGRTGSDG